MKYQLGSRMAWILVLVWVGGATAARKNATPAPAKPAAPTASAKEKVTAAPAKATAPTASAREKATAAPAKATTPTASARLQSSAPQDNASTSAAPGLVILQPAEDQAPPTALRDKQFFYGSFGLRDPFRSLVGGDFEPAEQQLVDLHTVQLVGMLWEDEAYVGIVQDTQGFGYALRPGDPVRNGVVVAVTRQELVGRLNVFGMVDRVNLRLQHVRDEE